MASTKTEISKAIRNAYRDRKGNGQGDLAYEDRAAGPNIHRDTNTWTVATPEEFARGSRSQREKSSNSKRPKDEESIRKKSGPSRHSTTSASTHGYFGGDTNENRMTRDKILDAYKKRRGGGKA